VIYDGIDGGPEPTGTSFPTVDYDGLGGLDLTAGLQDTFFELLLTFSDIGGPLILTVYEQGGAGSNYAQTTFALPGGVPTGSSNIQTKRMDLSDFNLFGTAALGDVFTNAGAIVMEINATAVAQEGWDMRIDYLKTRGTEPLPPPTPTPSPATLALLGAGLLGMRFVRRR
jgi:hypothetical protein